MANLIVRNIDDDIAQAPKQRASRHGISAETERRRILEQALKRPQKHSFVDVLREMPGVGRDEFFARQRDAMASGVFD